MDTAALLSAASQEPNAEKRRDFIKKNAPPDADPGDLLWQAFRAGTFDPSERPFWWTLSNARSGFSADDALDLLAAAAQGPADAAVAASQWGNLANVFSGLALLVDKSEEAAVVAGHARVGGYIGSLLRCLLAHRGHDVPVDPALLPDLTSALVYGSGSTHRVAQFARFFSRLGEVFTPPVWGEALKTALLDHLASRTHSIESYRDVTEALAAMTDAELVTFALPRCSEHDRERMVDLLLARRDTILPELMKLAEHWLASREAAGRSGRTLNILVSAILRIQLDAGSPLLPEKYDLLLQHAMWDSEGPLQSVLGHLPASRLEPLMLPDRSSPPYAYFHHCPTPKVMQHMVEQLRAQEGRVQWGLAHDAPRSIVKIGAPMLPLLHEAMRIGGGLSRHIFIRCLKQIGHPSSLPVLLRCLDDTGPRTEVDHSNGKVVRTHDIPAIATAALIAAAQTTPEAVLLPVLAAALADDSEAVRAGAVATLASMPITPAVLAAARAAVPGQSLPPLRRQLSHIARRGAIPEPLAAVRAVVLPQATVEATDAALDVAWRADDFDAFWQAHGAHGVAILAQVSERYREALATSTRTYRSFEVLRRVVPRCSDHPAAGAVLLDLLDSLPAAAEREALQLLTITRPALPALAADFLARCTDEARPPAWKAVLSYPTDWKLDRDDLLLDGLTDPSPALRQRCVRRLATRPLTDPGRVYPLLFSRSQDQRLEAVTLLAAFPLKASIPHLLAAQKKERAGRVKAALADALAAYAPADIAAAPALAPPKRPRKRRPARPTAAPKVRQEWTDWLAHSPLTRPDRTAWSQLTSQIEHLPPSAAEVDRLQEALAGWPDSLRAAPMTWIVGSMRKTAPAHWSLARSVRYTVFGSQGSMTPARLRWLFTSPHMATITWLSLEGLTRSKPRQAILDHLGGSIHLANLTHLTLSTCWLPRALIDGLLAATHLSRLTALHLTNNDLAPAPGMPGINALVDAPHLQGLKELFAYQANGSHFIDALKASSGMPALESVSVSYGQTLPAARIEAITGIDRPWREIILSGRGLSTATARAFAGSDRFAGLLKLSLSGNIGAEGVMALLESKKLPALQELRLSQCGVRESDAAAIKAHPRLKTLARFCCASYGLTNKSIEIGTDR